MGRAEGHHLRVCLLCVCEEQQGGDHPAQTRPEALIPLAVCGTLRPPGKSFSRVSLQRAVGHKHWGALLCCVLSLRVSPEVFLGTSPSVLGNQPPHVLTVIRVSHADFCRRFVADRITKIAVTAARRQCHAAKLLCGLRRTNFGFSLKSLHIGVYHCLSVARHGCDAT